MGLENNTQAEAPKDNLERGVDYAKVGSVITDMLEKGDFGAAARALIKEQNIDTHGADIAPDGTEARAKAEFDKAFKAAFPDMKQFGQLIYQAEQRLAQLDRVTGGKYRGSLIESDPNDPLVPPIDIMSEMSDGRLSNIKVDYNAWPKSPDRLVKRWEERPEKYDVEERPYTARDAVLYLRTLIEDHDIVSDMIKADAEQAKNARTAQEDASRQEDAATLSDLENQLK